VGCLWESASGSNKKYNDIEWGMIEEQLFDKIEERIEKLEQLVNLLIPYSELEYTSDYDKEDYSDEDEYPEPIYLIDANFDANYLGEIIEEMQEDIYELYYTVKEKYFENKEYIISLLEKQYKIGYRGINISYGVDIDGNTHEEDNEQVLYIYPKFQEDAEDDNSLDTDDFIDIYSESLIELIQQDGVGEIIGEEIQNTEPQITSTQKFKILSVGKPSEFHLSNAGVNYWEGYNGEDKGTYGSVVEMEVPIEFETVISLVEYNEEEEYQLLYNPLEILSNGIVRLQGTGITSVSANISGITDGNTIESIEEFEIQEISLLEEFRIHKLPSIIMQGQILGTSYFINIQLSNNDIQKLSNEIVYIDIRKYGIDKYLMNPNRDEATKYDKERFSNILENTEKKNWEFELRLNNTEPNKEQGFKYLTSKVFTSIRNYAMVKDIKDWFFDNYKKTNALPASFPIKFGEKDLQNFDAVKSEILSQFSTQYDADIIHQAINDIKEEYGDRAWEKKSLRLEIKDGNIKHLDGESYKEYVGSILNTKIYVPADKVYEFEVNDMYYDIEIHKISEQIMSESQATREMANQTGATHQGNIKFKDNQQGNIEELNRLIDENFSKEYGLAFYSIIDDEQEKEDYIDFIQAESDMEGWFSENYDDPANFLPYETREGGYQYLYGGPYELDEILYEEFGDKYPDEYIKRVIEGLEHQYGDVGWAKKPDESNNYFEDGYAEKGYVEFDDSYNLSIREKNFNNDKIKLNNNFTLCKIINLDMSYILKIKLIKNDTRRLFKGSGTIDIRDYYGIYNYLKLQSKKNQNNKKSKYDKLLNKLELQCWKLEIQIIEESIKNNDMEYLSDEIFRYTEQTFAIDTITSIEKDLIIYIQNYDFNKQVHLGDFTKSLSKRLRIYKNTVIRILYRWKFFEKIDFSQKDCTSNLEINRKVLKYILSSHLQIQTHPSD